MEHQEDTHGSHGAAVTVTWSRPIDVPSPPLSLSITHSPSSSGRAVTELASSSRRGTFASDGFGGSAWGDVVQLFVRTRASG